MGGDESVPGGLWRWELRREMIQGRKKERKKGRKQRVRVAYFSLL